ncbi:non-canonical purine NTP pyrophosphatase [Metalysinibacillus jejuensis]|uniref:non-canonical purine NTP pyrophosphatase n=1 Tax=Metalysinibacillus jejuensis TaxID=914327 RepID=UPI000D352C90|nr:non-canonical purine NTP pyrophosphatase [Metalysinibacillus jejuensis]
MEKVALLTGNKNKYAPFKNFLNGSIMEVVLFKEEILEIQAKTLEDVAKAKAEAVHKIYKNSFLIDDVGLFLDAYPSFPGPYTKHMLQVLGAEGFSKLIEGKSNKATFTCILSGYINEEFVLVKGEVSGKFDPTIPLQDGEMPLSTWFIPDVSSPYGALEHRFQALEKIKREIDFRRA